MNQPQYGWPASPYQQPWSPQQNQTPPRPPSNNTALIVVLLVVFFGLPSLVALATAGVGIWVEQQNIGARHIDASTIPKQIAEKLDCKKKCRVATIVTYDGGFSATVMSSEVEGRTLTYGIGPIGEASLTFSTDGQSSRPTFDPSADVNWKQMPKILDDLNRSAIEGKEVNTLIIMPCSGLAKPDEKVEVCVRATVLTKRGNESMTYDAKTGAPRAGGY